MTSVERASYRGKEEDDDDEEEFIANMASLAIVAKLSSRAHKVSNTWNTSSKH